MNATAIGLIAVVIVFVVDIVLLLGLVLLKAFHRRRTQRHELRRAAYVATLSRHLASNQQTDRIDEAAADDDAFIDAVIDLRNVVSGREIETLTGLVDGLGVVKRQEAKLRSRFPLGRRLRAAVSLAEIGDETTAPVLIQHISDREPEIRIQCARGLGRMQNTAGIDAILERLGMRDRTQLTRYAKQTNTTIILVGHVRLGGVFIGGPKHGLPGRPVGGFGPQFGGRSPDADQRSGVQSEGGSAQEGGGR